MSIDDRLRSGLGTLSAPVSASSGSIDGVVALGRRIAVRRRVAAASLAVAVLGVAVGVGTLSDDPDGTSLRTADGGVAIDGSAGASVEAGSDASASGSAGVAAEAQTPGASLSDGNRSAPGALVDLPVVSSTTSSTAPPEKGDEGCVAAGGPATTKDTGGVRPAPGSAPERTTGRESCTYKATKPGGFRALGAWEIRITHPDGSEDVLTGASGERCGDGVIRAGDVVRAEAKAAPSAERSFVAVGSAAGCG